MRSQSLLAALSLGSAALALHDQFPVNTGDRPLDIVNSYADNAFPYDSPSSNSEQWRFDKGPPENATGNLIFDTVHSFLQHWPNTRYRNGMFSPLAGARRITLLYHGTNSDTIPTEPDWVAADPEHSIIFASGRDESGWHLTLAATRPLKVLYFDGSSAAKVMDGSLDIQFLVAWGDSIPGRVNDGDLIKALCAWGKEFGIDGFVRMEMDFEVMLCDFTAGVEVVSFLHVVIPKDEMSYPDPGPPPLDSDIWIRSFEVMQSGSWRNRYPGDSRIVLDLTGLISLYDPSLAPSLIPVRAGRERWDHRVLGISSEDISRMMIKLTEVVSRPDTTGSGIDWKTLFHAIVDRYADRLELMQYILNFASLDSQAFLQRAKLAQAQLRVMLTPYLLRSTVVPSQGTSGTDASQWASPIFRHCATTHTSAMINKIPFMTSSERLLLKAVEDTTREICRVTTKMWANGVMSGLDPLFRVERNGELEVTQLMNEWRQEIHKLMAWLDWSVWIKCRPACGPQEMCYLPTWPINAPFPDDDPPPPPPPGIPRNTTDAPEENYLADLVGPRPERRAVADALFFLAPAAEDWGKASTKMH
ncbi:uncharacterized protein EDB91DRAFT_1300049 [Suillus paluster]|uniref:uncharacterized protein n=1 Tax=Suillus paluster TaxID=48578 RepID=UPI001B86B831|nr:uncharacterized protein EDB91DRAFT_1300049 [Suillus paluster]KAG1733653.1 hypothetical protein EDB91DRAFT_1300049 [Suillus paluster]